MFVVVTGGPGAGKSTLIARLRLGGFACVEEAGRAIIRDQVLVGGRALPWVDPVLFAEMMLGWDLRSCRDAAGRPAPVFFDRGIPDIVGYLRLLGREVPPHLDRAARSMRYQRIFLAPPWPEIYRQDTERRQSFAEAERTYEHMVASYTDYGYDLVTLPLASVEERVRFVTDALNA